MKYNFVNKLDEIYEIFREYFYICIVYPLLKAPKGLRWGLTYIW